jgi:hypothetical protein
MGHWWSRVLNFLGGAIGRAAATALVVGFCLVVFGGTPGELLAAIWTNPPQWVMSWWFSPTISIVGLLLIAATLRFNLWDQRQKAIDDLAEDMSWAIHNLLNKPPTANSAAEFVSSWESDFKSWCDKVSKKLGNKAFFTRADQLHFDRLGFVSTAPMTGHAKLDWLLAMLRLKFERLRDIINWVQQRRR